jgi:predicted HicB family RNase H-like nuclease
LTMASDTTKTQFNLRLPDDMLEQVDERAKALGISRNQWYENMTRWVLANTYTIEQRPG